CATATPPAALLRPGGCRGAVFTQQLPLHITLRYAGAGDAAHHDWTAQRDWAAQRDRTAHHGGIICINQGPAAAADRGGPGVICRIVPDRRAPARSDRGR